MDEEPVIRSQSGWERAVLVSVEQWNHMVALLKMYRSIWHAESDRVQAENQYVHADTLTDALVIYKEQL